MTIERIRKDIEIINKIVIKYPMPSFVREHFIGIVIATNLPYKYNPYEELFNLGINNEILDYIHKYTMFTICCNIYKRPEKQIVNITRTTIENFKLNILKL